MEDVRSQQNTHAANRYCLRFFGSFLLIVHPPPRMIYQTSSWPSCICKYNVIYGPKLLSINAYKCKVNCPQGQIRILNGEELKGSKSTTASLAAVKRDGSRKFKASRIWGRLLARAYRLNRFRTLIRATSDGSLVQYLPSSSTDEQCWPSRRGSHCSITIDWRPVA